MGENLDKTYSLVKIAPQDLRSNSKKLPSGQAIEAGLSPGEVRQALFDRVKAGVTQGKLEELTPWCNLWKLKEPSPTSTQAQEEFLKETEEALYATSLENLEGLPLPLPGEVLLVKGDAA